jgi:2-amino-4-hydroxy-6-hydroxymethyldihydropteridine diphosphokinase
LTTAVLGLGGNIGDNKALIAAAIDCLAEDPAITIEAASALYETPPWGKVDQPPFLNAAVRIETSHSARRLLQTILDVERRLGRERTERWGPRTIDIDILLFGESKVAEPGLIIPHPRLAERAFALVPLIDVLPDATISGRPAREWLSEMDSSGIRRIDARAWRGALHRRR